MKHANKQSNRKKQHQQSHCQDRIQSNQIKMGISFEKEKSNPIIIFNNRMVILDWIVCALSIVQRVCLCVRAEILIRSIQASTLHLSV